MIVEMEDEEPKSAFDEDDDHDGGVDVDSNEKL